MTTKKILFTLALASAVSSFATLIDFQDLGVYSPGQDVVRGDFYSRGYFFDTTINHCHIANAPSWGYNNGSTYLGIDGADSGNMVHISGSSPFSLHNLQLSRANNSSSATAVEILGYLTTGGTVQTQVILNPGFYFYNLGGSSWSSLSAVRLRGLGSGSATFAVDNIDVTAIPEPSTIAFLGLFGGGLLTIRRYFLI